jgi:hypothetical protein
VTAKVQAVGLAGALRPCAPARALGPLALGPLALGPLALGPLALEAIRRRQDGSAFALVVTAVLCASSANPSAAQAPAGLRWFKGNTHTHTLNSDGDSSPDDVARWYREHGYHFLVLSDHNYLTSVEGLNALFGADQRFLIIPARRLRM